MESATKPAIQIYDELERREAGVGHTLRRRIWKASLPMTSATMASTTTTAAAAVTAPRSASGDRSPVATRGHFHPTEDEREQPAPLLAPAIDTLVSAEEWG